MPQYEIIFRPVGKFDRLSNQRYEDEDKPPREINNLASILPTQLIGYAQRRTNSFHKQSWETDDPNSQMFLLGGNMILRGWIDHLSNKHVMAAEV